MTTRMLNTLRLDAVVQWRNGFLYVSAIVVVLLIVLVRTFVPSEFFAIALPSLFVGVLAATTYMFAGALILLEKSQRTLEAQVVTPLRPHELLTARVTSLSILATVESILILAFTAGTQLNWLPMLAGVIAVSIFYTLIGLAMVVRYDSVTDFLMPSVLLISLLQLTPLYLLEIGPGWVYYLLPTHPATLLMYGGFAPLTIGQWLYASIGAVVAIGGAAFWCRRAFEYHIVRDGRGN